MARATDAVQERQFIATTSGRAVISFGTDGSSPVLVYPLPSPYP